MVDFLLGVPGKLKTLLDRLTATRAGYLDASISSRASSSALTTVDSEVGTILADTADMQPKIATMYTRGQVKSIQTVELNDATASSSSGNYAKYRNVTISSVDTTKSIIIGLAMGSNGTSRQFLIAAGSSVSAYGMYRKFTSSTNIQLGYPLTFITNISCSLQVVEFY